MAVRKGEGLKERPARGRPRDPEVESRILRVTLRLLAEQGYRRMSLDQIAAEAGVSKPSIYLRWPGKAGLAAAALQTIQFSEPPVESRTTPGSLVGILQDFRKSLLRPNGMSLIGTALAEENQTPQLMALFRARILVPFRQILRSVLERARQRGELRPGADIQVAVNMLIGAFYARYLANSKIPARYPSQLVSVIWEGIGRRRPLTQPRRSQ